MAPESKNVLSQAELEEILHGVDGWLHPAEALELYTAARTHRNGQPVVVEIGSWMGRSTIALARGLIDRGSNGKVTAIDPVIVTIGETEESAEQRYEGFLANLEQKGVRGSVDVLRQMSHDARPRFADGSIDVLFVDGSHEYEDVLVDLEDWTPALAEGAIVGFNDPLLPGVRRAFHERIIHRGTPYRRPRFIVNSIFFDFARDERWTRSDSVDAWRLSAFLRAGTISRRMITRMRSGAPRPWKARATRLLRRVVSGLLPGQR
jgi:MMP 1-O-methyltransferase